MPDRRAHRGPHPEDGELFAASRQAGLCAAAADLCWLLSRGYPSGSAMKLVGDRYALTARQRIAVQRSACSDADAARRRAHELQPEQLRGRPLWIDGYNVLTTLEAALAGGVILAGRDGCYRDMASMHGSFRKVAETGPALVQIGAVLAEWDASECLWLLDRPVSNSGRLKTLIEHMAAEQRWPWRVELVPNPDVLLWQTPHPVATADSAVLDRCAGWVNLGKWAVARRVPNAWIVEVPGPAQRQQSRESPPIERHAHGHVEEWQVEQPDNGP